MGKRTSISIKKLAKGEKGQVLVLTLVMLLVGGLIIAPLMAHMGTGLKTGLVFEEKTDELYAADAGVENGMWRIKWGGLETLDTPTGYDTYDYTTEWTYTVGEPVNDEDVAITLSNVWIPKGIATPDATEARNIIDEGYLTVEDSAPGSQDCHIRIDYYPEEAWGDLQVEKIGVWLPVGFEYVTGSSNLEADLLADYYSVPVVGPHTGGQAVVWSFSSLLFDSLPRAAPTDPPGSAVVTFQFTSEATRRPEAICWIVTSGVPEVPYSWNSATKIYGITSVADGNTTIESFVALNARFSSLFDNAITSPGDITIQPGAEVNGDVQYNGVLDNRGTITGDETTDDIDWPSSADLSGFYLSQVASAPDPGATIDIKDTKVLGPVHRNGNLTIKNTGTTDPELTLEDTIYVTGDLVFQQPGGPKAYTINLNRQTIFVEGSITFPADKVTVAGSGCIIAIGDVNFQPSIESDETSFVFVMSLEGEVNFNPNGDFYGSIAGNTNVDLQPGSSLNWRPPIGGLNFPGLGGQGTSGFGTDLTIYTWEIR